MRENLAIILAGGSGTRINDETPKQFIELAGKPIMLHTIEIFETNPGIDAIFVVSSSAFPEQAAALIEKENYQKVLKILQGGKTRQESSYTGIMAAKDKFKNILIHDAVRPFVTKELIDELIRALHSYPAVVPGIPSADTIIRVDHTNRVREIPNRNFLRRVQTPQAFRGSLIKKAHTLALKNRLQNVSDDCSLVMEFKLSEIFVIPGSPENIKITYPPDLALGEEIIRNRHKKIPG